MQDTLTSAPEATAVRVALWRALHVQADPPPHVFEDVVGLQLAAPGDDWHRRADMDLQGSARARASIVARSRCVEDLVAAQVRRGVRQYLILGAGLDTFAQRMPPTPGLQVFEMDAPGPQSWKRDRLAALGWHASAWLHFVPVDFEAGEDGWDRLTRCGFDPRKPTVVASTGVIMYLTRAAILATLRQLARLPGGSTLVMSFMLPIDRIEPAERAGRLATEQYARAAGTPFLSFFTPEEMLALVRQAGIGDVHHLSAADLAQRYFAGRTDGLRPSSSEEIVVATIHHEGALDHDNAVKR